MNRCARFSLSVCLLLALSACSSTSVERGAQGALTGAAAGAVSSMFAAAIFGGNVGDAAARGAAWGAGVGAVSGAVQGSAEDRRKREREQAEAQRRQLEELNRLRAEIGDDNFAGLEALTDGKHEVAMAYARTATRSGNDQFELAGHWLEVLTQLDAGHTEEVDRHVPHLVEMDSSVTTNAEARQILNDLLTGLADIRKEFGVKA